MKHTKAISLLGLFLATILYVAINVLFNISSPEMRIDVTEDELYTLSEATRNTLQRIDEPVMFHFFFSGRLAREVPFYSSYRRRVRELLTEITEASNGKVVLHTYNPEPFSHDEDRAVRFGVQGIPLDQGKDLAYFGLVGTNSVDDIESIPFFQPERETLLEYDLVRMISALSNYEPTKVGVISSLPIMGDMQAQLQGGVLIPWAIANELQKYFELINLPQSIDSLPENIDLMMVVHPRKLNDRAIYELEQFLFRGGRAIFFIDPKAESDLSTNPSQTSSSAINLQRLFNHWGISIPDDKLIGDRSLALRINAGTAAQPVPAKYLLWLGVAPENMNQADPITSQLPGLNIATPGYLLREADSPLSIEPLITTSTNSAPIHPDETAGLRPDVLGILDRFIPDDNQYVIAARLSGSVTTAFEEGPPAALVVKDGSVPEQLVASDGAINVVVIADSDLLEERFWLQKQQFFGREMEEKIAGNADFIVNAIENLTGSDELLKLRSRGVSQRPFERIQSLEQEAEQQLQDKERELQDKLKETQARIVEMEGTSEDSVATAVGTATKINLTNDQRQTIEGLRQEMLSIRKQLREVQHMLRKEIDVLKFRIRFINIGLVPIAVLSIAALIWIVRRLRRRRSYIGHFGEKIS